MGKTTCFSSLGLSRRHDDSDHESLAPEDEDDDVDVDDAYTPDAFQDLTEVVDPNDEEDPVQFKITFQSRCASLKSVIVSGHGLICLYVGLSIFTVGSLVALILVCVQVVKPYVSVWNYVETDCINVAVQTDGSRGCMCGIGCNNRYHCLQIIVKYPLTSTNSSQWVNATMFEDESILAAECSFFPSCRSSQAKIDHLVRAYLRNYGQIGQHHKCYHSTQPAHTVIRTKRFHTSHVVHGMLWTLLGIVLSLLGMLYTYKRKKFTVV